jgi:carbonic anhydrase
MIKEVVLGESDNKIDVTKFMNALDFEDRWIYKGSYTEPPCTGGVYWNVLRNVYPIDNNKLESIKEKLVKLAAENDPDNYKYDPEEFT